MLPPTDSGAPYSDTAAAANKNTATYGPDRNGILECLCGAVGTSVLGENSSDKSRAAGLG
jgi:hypothetical protein